MNPQMKMFYGRLRRIARIHRNGGGFEAAGTLGQSYYTRMARRHGRPVVRPILYMVGAVIASKALLLASMGRTEYAERVIALEAGNTVERIGAYLMGIDPVTLAVSDLFRPLLGA